MIISDILLIITAIITALMAGFFFSYSISVSLGLGKLNDKEFLNAMKNINQQVQNSLFFACFFGTPLMLFIVSLLHYNQNSFIFLLIASLSYIIGVFGVTVFINVPLNNRLDLFDIPNSTEMTINQMRHIFEKPWNIWNHIRTVASLISIFFVILACVYK